MIERCFWKDRFFWIAFSLSLVIHASWFSALCAAYLLWPTKPPMLLLPYGDADVEGLSVSTISADSGSLYQDTMDRPGGEVMPGPISREPAAAAHSPQPDAPRPVAIAELVPVETLVMPLPDVIALQPATVPAELPATRPIIEAEKPSPMPPPDPKAEAKPSADPRDTAASARGLRAPNGVGTNPAEAPGLGKAKGEQGSSRMAPGIPSAGGRVGYATGVSLISYPKPVYPPEARRAGMEGTVMVWLRVSADGRVVEAKLQRSSGYSLLDQAALQFAHTVRLSPARQGSTSVEGEATLPVVYRLLD